MAGVLSMALSLGAANQNLAANVPGDGVMPTNSIVTKVLGLETQGTHHLVPCTSDCSFDNQQQWERDDQEIQVRKMGAEEEFHAASDTRERVAVAFSNLNIFLGGLGLSALSLAGFFRLGLSRKALEFLGAKLRSTQSVISEHIPNVSEGISASANFIREKRKGIAFIMLLVAAAASANTVIEALDDYNEKRMLEDTHSK